VAKGHFLNETDETWQCGLRLYVHYGSSFPGDHGDFGGEDLIETSVSRTETDWDIVSSFKVGFLTNVFNVDDYLNDQAAPAWAALINDCASVHVQLDSIKASPILDSGDVWEDRTAELTWTAAFPIGSLSGDMLPTSISSLLSVKTGLVGRRGRGRLFLPPAGKTQLDADGRMTSTAQTNLVGFGQTFFPDVAYKSPAYPGWSAVPIVAGKGPGSATFDHWGRIDSVNVNNVFSDQRRRKRQAVASRVAGGVSY